MFTKLYVDFRVLLIKKGLNLLYNCEYNYCEKRV